MSYARGGGPATAAEIDALVTAAPTAHDPGDEHARPADPPHPPASSWFSMVARTTANAMACRLGGPVYLVGSALTLPHPADIDVRVVLGAADLERLFGRKRDRPIGEWGPNELAQGREQLKQSRRLSRRFRRNIDFQIQTEEEADRYSGRPRLRLDAIPDEVFAAGLGDA